MTQIQDPDEILKHQPMSLNAKRGHKVTVTKETITWGYPHDKEKAKEFLEAGETYTVEIIDAGDFSSTVVLQEIPNQRFNTVHFIDSDQKLSINNDDIKKECEQMYAQIKSAEERLRELRTICKHETTFEGNYSWRIGTTQKADICEYCNELIRYK